MYFFVDYEQKNLHSERLEPIEMNHFTKNVTFQDLCSFFLQP